MTSDETIRRAAEVLTAHPSIPNYRKDLTDRDYVCPTCGDTALVYGPNSPDHALHQAEQLAEAGLLHDALPTPADGCQCTGHSQDYGGYVEFLMEYEPSCPEHSEHVWNPRTGMWEHTVDPAEGDGGADQ